MTRGDWGRLVATMTVAAAVLALGAVLVGCGPKSDESKPCKGWESLPGATCGSSLRLPSPAPLGHS